MKKTYYDNLSDDTEIIELTKSLKKSIIEISKIPNSNEFVNSVVFKIDKNKKLSNFINSINISSNIIMKYIIEYYQKNYNSNDCIYEYNSGNIFNSLNYIVNKFNDMINFKFSNEIKLLIYSNLSKNFYDLDISRDEICRFLIYNISLMYIKAKSNKRLYKLHEINILKNIKNQCNQSDIYKNIIYISKNYMMADDNKKNVFKLFKNFDIYIPPIFYTNLDFDKIKYFRIVTSKNQLLLVISFTNKPTKKQYNLINYTEKLHKYQKYNLYNYDFISLLVLSIINNIIIYNDKFNKSIIDNKNNINMKFYL